MTQGEHRRDAGVIFENTESAQTIDSDARQDKGGSPGAPERGRDGGVVFENTGAPRRTGSHAKPEEGIAPSQSGHARDAGVSFENTESERQPEVQGRRHDVPGPGERSRDAGLVFENTDNHQQPASRAEQGDGSVSSMLSSVMELGGAATRFTLDQVENAVRMVTDPAKAMERLQHSIDNFSKALKESVEDAPPGSDDRKP